MSLTFNSNNNYSVEIITESNLGNISSSNGPGEGIQFSATTNTPFVTLKIIPTNPQSQPVLASNIKIDDIIPDFAWNAYVNYNTNGICMPPPTPHNVNSSLQHVTGIGVTSTCQSLGFTGFTGNSNEGQQGPYSAQNDFAVQANQIANNGVSWSEIILIEVYEDDNGDKVNDDHSPATIENYNEWAMWVGPTQTAIYDDPYPIYVKAFVFLSFDTGGPSALTNNVTLNLDFDEVPPIFGCTDPTADNHDSTATIDDGSCTYPPPPPPPPPVFTLPPFTFTHTVTQNLIDLAWDGTSNGGLPNLVTMLMLTVDAQPAINTWYGSTGVNYEITELYYIDDTGAQVDIERTTNSSLLTPPYALLPIGIGYVYYFDPATGSNISTYTTPANITAGVLLGAPNNISGVILPNDGTGFTIDVYCTVTAYDQPANISTSSHTEMITITV
jgi:hypothetical protein